MKNEITPQVGDVVDVWGNRGEVVEVYTSEAGTPFIKFEDIEGNTYRFPERLVEVIFADVEGRLVAASEVEEEPTPGLWYDGEAMDCPTVESKPRSIWAQEVA